MDLLYKIACRIFHPLRIHISSWRPSRDEYFRVSSLIKELGSVSIIDVGANSGQFAMGILGYAVPGNIYSFEPQSEIHAKLVANASARSNWKIAERCALGDSPGTLELKISKNTYSSSLLEVKPISVKAAPQSACIGRETVSVLRLDDWVAAIGLKGPFFLKIDTQGYELKVLQGATGILPEIHGLLVECSLVPQYDGQPLLQEIMDFLNQAGFQVIDILPGLRDPETGRFLGLDLLAKRILR